MKQATVVPVTVLESNQVAYIVVDKVLCLVQDNGFYHIVMVSSPASSKISQADGDEILDALGYGGLEV